MLQLAFRGLVAPVGSPETLRILSSREFGASNALLHLAKDIGLHHILYSRSQPWVKAALAMVIGLLCNTQGCPVGCEVFKGNTNDATTVAGKIDELRHSYDLKRIIFVGDRGMLTAARRKDLSGIEGLATISALTHGELAELIKRALVEPELFDENNIVEISDPEKEGEPYCLCRNPVTAASETERRRRLITLSEEGLAKIAAYKQTTTVEILGARIGKLLAKYKMGKFIIWEIESDRAAKKSRGHRVKWRIDEEKAKRELDLDGCYIIRTDVPEEEMSTKETVAGYKSLGNVERAFRSLKTAHLEIRPIYHKSDDRIKGHIFMCMLAYYLEWHMIERRRPFLERAGEGSDRRWTVAGVIARLGQIQRNRVSLHGIEFDQIPEADEEQKEILTLLKTAV
ncbi:MAG: transposase [Paracoccaceae bacterium]|jgi:transposase